MTNLLDILREPNDKLIAVDLDWTLCTWEFWNATDRPEPIPERIEFVNSLYKRGAHIIIYTARFPEHYPETLGWLIANRVQFHWICMQKKCGADCYIDDKAIHIDAIDKLISEQKWQKWERLKEVQ